MAAVNEQRVFHTTPSYSSISVNPDEIGPVREIITDNLTVNTINGASYPPPPGTGYVTFTGVETLSNKSLVDNSTYIIDVVDPTKRIMFDAAGTTGTTTTMRATQTANRTYTMPDMGADTDFIFAAGAQTITGSKLFTAGAMRIANSVDTSVQTVFVTGNAPAGTIATITTSGLTTSRQYTLIDPGANTEILLGTATQTVTGTKTFPETARMARAADNTVYMRFLPGAAPAGTVTTIATTGMTASRTYNIIDAGATADFVMTAGTQVLSGKSFIDSGTFIVDPVNQTIRMAFDAAGSANTTLTIRGTQTANRIYTMPDMGTNTSFLFAAGTQTATGKSFVDNSTFIVNNANNNIRMAFSATGTAGTVGTIRTSQTASHVYLVPDTPTDDTFTMIDMTQALTNKTITDANNTVAAKQLHTTTGVVDVSASAAPVAGYVLTATSATTATWQTPASAPTTFSDATFAIYDSVDNTKQITFDADGTAGTTATIRVTQTANRIYTIPPAPADDTFALLDTTQTLANKALVDTTTTIVDSVDPTIKIAFNAAGTAGTTATIRALQAANRIYTIQDVGANANFLFDVGAQTLQDKSLIDNTTFIVDNADPTIRIGFNAVGTAGTTTTLRATQTANRVLTFPSGGVAANVLLSEGDQTANGINTFSNSIVTPIINEFVLNAGTVINDVTIRSRTYVAGTINLASIEAGNGAATDVYLGLLSLGTGAIVAAIPTGNAVGGNARGANAIDFQVVRAAANQVASGANAGLFAGTNNRALGARSVVLSGDTNAILATTDSAIVSGTSHSISAAATSSIIGGGTNHNVTAIEGGIFCGNGGTVSGTGSFIGGGGSNTVACIQGSITGGFLNNITAASQYGFIGGGNGNGVQSVNGACVAGQNGVITGIRGFNGCGLNNSVGGQSAANVGGEVNIVNGQGAFNGGGFNNTVSGNRAACVGGDTNLASGLDSFVGGGFQCQATNSYAVCNGGNTNTASGQYSGVLYGRGNTASGDYSAAMGRGAESTGVGSLTITDGTTGGLTNVNNNRFISRFFDGYRFLTGPTTTEVVPVRINNQFYMYSGGQGLTYNGVGGDPSNRWTEIILPTTNGSIWYEITMIGSPAVTGGFAGQTVGLAPPWHRTYEQGTIATAPAGSGYASVITRDIDTQVRSSNFTTAPIANSIIGTSVLTGPPRIRIFMTTGGAYGANFRWQGVAKFYIEDNKASDPF